MVGKKRGPRNDAIIIKASGGRSYADLLRCVKKEVNEADTGVHVTAIRKTRAGDLLVAIKKDPAKEATDRLKKRIEEKVGEVKLLRSSERKVALQIFGMDADTNKEDIVDALERELLQGGGKLVEVNALWPSFGEMQNASISMPAAEATHILRKGRIKVGWVWCRVREKKGTRKCYRCWGVGHVATDCVGPDRTELCHGCGKAGHLARTCQEVKFCPACKEEGHSAGTTGCPAFKKALAEVTGSPSRNRQAPMSGDIGPSRGARGRGRGRGRGIPRTQEGERRPSGEEDPEGREDHRPG